MRRAKSGESLSGRLQHRRIIIGRSTRARIFDLFRIRCPDSGNARNTSTLSRSRLIYRSAAAGLSCAINFAISTRSASARAVTSISNRTFPLAVSQRPLASFLFPLRRIGSLRLLLRGIPDFLLHPGSRAIAVAQPDLLEPAVQLRFGSQSDRSCVTEYLIYRRISKYTKFQVDD